MIDEAIVTSHKSAVGLVEKAVCKKLRSLAAKVPADQAIVEIGAFKGRATGWLALGASEGHGATVTTVDPWEMRPEEDWPVDYPDWHAVGERSDYGHAETYEAFRAHLARCGIEAKARGRAQVEIRRGLSTDVAKRWSGPIGLLWHDADHSAEAVEADLRAWSPFVVPGGAVILHDVANEFQGVMAGAAAVLDAPGWDWRRKEITVWRKRPNRRGSLLVRRLK